MIDYRIRGAIAMTESDLWQQLPLTNSRVLSVIFEGMSLGSTVDVQRVIEKLMEISSQQHIIKRLSMDRFFPHEETYTKDLLGLKSSHSSNTCMAAKKNALYSSPPLQLASSSNLFVSLGACSVVGFNHTHTQSQDRFATSSSTVDKIHYAAVFDGHAGSEASDFLLSHLLDNIHKENTHPTHTAKAIANAILRTDAEFLDLCAAEQIDCGSTACGVLLMDSFLFAFNVGDSHAVLCRDGYAVPLLPLHKPDTPQETTRILSANGWITRENNGDGIMLRVCGDLAVSRSIGDPGYKLYQGFTSTSPYIDWPVGHSRLFSGDVITAQPDVCQLRITLDFEFVIVASDGLWDVVTPCEAVARAREILASGELPTSVANSLAVLAKYRGSDDDTTVVIVVFEH